MSILNLEQSDRPTSFHKQQSSEAALLQLLSLPVLTAQWTARAVPPPLTPSAAKYIRCNRTSGGLPREDVGRWPSSTRRRSGQWDEGRYLDGYVDEFGDVADILAWKPKDRPAPSAAYLALTNQSEMDEPQSHQPFDKAAREAHLTALQFLFAYTYDWRTTRSEHSVESDWTVRTQCALSQSGRTVPHRTCLHSSLCYTATSSDISQRKHEHNGRANDDL
ncbi:hypothetical protein A4X13_0g9340 [Tilletia indica]|uniref:Shq1 C-terminal domain-containing protein n=1 Tax=Tilletia indica TaxID=43049 RepID=A0A8T8SA61_9BASI|nr:hypothetical protein A4X13_0g9340 [Tilletia indica]